jgi:hypothetical protein
MLINLLKYSFNSFTGEKILQMGGRGVSATNPYELLTPPTLPATISPAIFRNRFFRVALLAKSLQVSHIIRAAISERNNMVTLSITWKHHPTTLPALILVTQQHGLTQSLPATTTHTLFSRPNRLLHGDSVLLNRSEP